MVRRLPNDPQKRRLQVFKRIYQHLDHFRALAEDRGMDQIITDPVTGEDIYLNDLLVGLDSLPGQQRKAFELICLQGYTETAARDVLLPNSKSSTPVQQYVDSGLARVVDAYDLYQVGKWPPPQKPKTTKIKRRSLIMTAMHPLVRQGLEATRKKILSEIDVLKSALAWIDEQLSAKVENTPGISSVIPTSYVPIEKPDLAATAKEMVAAAMQE